VVTVWYGEPGTRRLRDHLIVAFTEHGTKPLRVLGSLAATSVSQISVPRHFESGVSPCSIDEVNALQYTRLPTAQSLHVDISTISKLDALHSVLSLYQA
jgi:hypothetical protein